MGIQKKLAKYSSFIGWLENQSVCISLKVH